MNVFKIEPYRHKNLLNSNRLHFAGHPYYKITESVSASIDILGEGTTTLTREMAHKKRPPEFFYLFKTKLNYGRVH